MSYNPTIAIVILNWNGRELLEQYLPSVIQNSQYPGVVIYVADNDSTDESIQFLNDKYPDEVKIIQNDGNHGYAKGYNDALNGLTEKYFILLNSDVEVAPNWLAPIIELMETNDKIAACQPKLLSFKNKDEFEYAGACGGYLDHFGYPFCRGRIFDSFEYDQGQYDDNAKIFWASGAALFIQSKLFFEAGGFEEDFFAHMEEIDLCWRLQRMGYEIRVCPKSVIYHLGGGTLQKMNPRKTYLNFRNNRLMLIKNIDRKHMFPHFILRNFMDIIAAFQALAYGNFKESGAILKALFDFHMMLPKWMKKRREIRTRLNLVNDHVKLYPRSIVFQYFIKKKKAFKDLTFYHKK